MSNYGNPQNCESLWKWLPADFQLVVRTAPVRKCTLHISVWPSHRQIKLWAHVLNAHQLNFGCLWYSHWTNKSITWQHEMQTTKLPLVCMSHSLKGVNVLRMCYHCLWEEVLVVVSADVKVRLRNQVFHTFPMLWHFSCTLFIS